MKPTLQELLNSEDYNSTKGINIIYTGLLMLGNSLHLERISDSVMECLEIDNEQLEFQKRNKNGTLWYVRCRANNMQQAHHKILGYLSDIFSKKDLKNISIALQVSLAHFSHKEMGSFFSDPIDYGYLEQIECGFSDAFKSLIEPTEPCFAVWDGKVWLASI